MEAIMNVDQLRKRASVLGIKNAKKYKKVELIVLVSNAEKALVKKAPIKKAESKPVIKEEKKQHRRLLKTPRGTQSKQIYQMLIEHPSWSHYKIRTLLGCTYTNVRRVWLLYVKDQNIDKRVKK